MKIAIIIILLENLDRSVIFFSPKTEQNVRTMVICQQGKTELSEEICRQLVSHKVEVCFIVELLCR